MGEVDILSLFLSFIHPYISNYFRDTTSELVFLLEACVTFPPVNKTLWIDNCIHHKAK